jgi:hypothetical protein
MHKGQMEFCVHHENRYTENGPECVPEHGAQTEM